MNKETIQHMMGQCISSYLIDSGNYLLVENCKITL